MLPCLFCGGDAGDPEHMLHCDGRQGHVEHDIEWPTFKTAAPEFDGATYEPERDGDRLRAQLARVLGVMLDHQWHTLGDIEAITHDEKQSISARLRDLRKPKFGGYQVDRRYVAHGLFEYRLLRLEEHQP